MKVFITRIISPDGLQLLQNAGILFTQWTEKKDLLQDDLISVCKNYDALISVGQDKIDKKFLHACSHLKVIAQMAVGFDNIDVAEATKLNIPEHVP